MGLRLFFRKNENNREIIRIVAFELVLFILKK